MPHEASHVSPAGGGFPILSKDLLAPKVTRYDVQAPQVSRSWRAGQFVIVRPCDDSERIPLTVADAHRDHIVLVVQEVGKTTAVMADLMPGDALADVCGPLGEPTHIARQGNVVVAGGGIGIAPAWPIARALRAAGNHVIGILGARTRDLLILEDEMRRACNELLVMTDDGSYGTRGFVTSALGELLEAGRRIDQVVAIGPALMMRAVAERTRTPSIPTVVSLNTVMIDGTGMCGGCRVEVAGQTRFVCVDGPEFDGHKVDFDLMIRRQAMYVGQERGSYDEYLRTRGCRSARTPVGSLVAQP
jgi:ferredoxin--NADP+ reductase